MALNCLTETMWARRCRPGTYSLRAFPFDLSRATCRPGNLSQRQVARDSLDLSLGKMHIPEYFTYFSSRLDATGRKSIGPILKCTSAIRQLTYGTAPDAFDEYLQIAERTS
ncbi:hypothetical protein Tco_0070592 [Tanacetum coccineum]